jgi:branched-subunit amino acid ABC-type transport system permease component
MIAGFVSTNIILDMLSQASMLILASIGLSLVFGYMGVLNFAHGAFYMLGGYVLVYIIQATGSFWLALVAAPIVVGIIAIALDRLLINRIYEAGMLTQVLVFLGLSFIIHGVILHQFGGERRSIAYPEILAGTVEVLGETYPLYNFALIFVGGLFIAAIWIGLSRTRLGLVVRASLLDRKMTQALGNDIFTIYTWFLAGALALTAFAGALMVPVRGLGLGTGPAILLDTFIVVIIGGVGSYRGTVVAGLLVTAVDVLVARYVSIRLSGLTLFLILLIVLLVKPNGLFGQQELHG